MTTLQNLLWHPERDSYVILNGAKIGYELIERLWAEEQNEEVFCLFSGELAPDMAEVAPYLVKLVPDSALSTWVCSGWGRAQSLFLQVSPETATHKVVRSLRRLTTVYHPQHQLMYFLYYHPQVWRNDMPLRPVEHQRAFFEHALSFIAEGPTPDYAEISSWQDGLQQQRIQLSA